MVNSANVTFLIHFHCDLNFTLLTIPLTLVEGKVQLGKREFLLQKKHHNNKQINTELKITYTCTFTTYFDSETTFLSHFPMYIQAENVGSPGTGTTVQKS